METIRSKGFDQTYELAEIETDQPVKTGGTVISFRGEAATLKGGTAPLHEASTGRVYVEWIDGSIRGGQELYPSVFGLKWLPAH